MTMVMVMVTVMVTVDSCLEALVWFCLDWHVPIGFQVVMASGIGGLHKR